MDTRIVGLFGPLFLSLYCVEKYLVVAAELYAYAQAAGDAHNLFAATSASDGAIGVFTCCTPSVLPWSVAYCCWPLPPLPPVYRNVPAGRENFVGFSAFISMTL